MDRTASLDALEDAPLYDTSNPSIDKVVQEVEKINDLLGKNEADSARYIKMLKHKYLSHIFFVNNGRIYLNCPDETFRNQAGYKRDQISLEETPGTTETV